MRERRGMAASSADMCVRCFHSVRRDAHWTRRQYALLKGWADYLGNNTFPLTVPQCVHRDAQMTAISLTQCQSVGRHD